VVNFVQFRISSTDDATIGYRTYNTGDWSLYLTWQNETNRITFPIIIQVQKNIFLGQWPCVWQNNQLNKKFSQTRDPVKQEIQFCTINAESKV
jgi:hypothetical protein